VGPTLWLMSGRAAGLAVAFVIPMVLARSFDQQEFGTYRLLFLMYATTFIVAQFGMAESLYYFVPRHADRAGQYVANALAMLAAAGLACIAIGFVTTPWFARVFHNPRLTTTLPKLAVFLAIMLVSAGLEIILVSRNRYRSAGLLYAASDIARAAVFAVPALIFRSVDALLIGGIVYAVARIVVLVQYVRREFAGAVRLDWQRAKEQLRYALPFAAAVVVEVAQLNLHQYAVAAWFDSATFAIYSVGCLQVPLVDLLATSAGNVMMVSMADQIRQHLSPLALWHETVSRLALVFLPLTGVVLLTARELIVLMFTPAYAGSVPIFMVSSLSIVLAILPVDGVLRVYAATRYLLVLNILRLTLIATSITWFVSAFHLPGAVLVTLVATAAAKTLAVRRVGRLLNVPFSRVLPWRTLGAVALAATCAAVPALLVRRHLGPTGFSALAITAGVYATTYLALLGAAWMVRTWYPQPVLAVAKSHASGLEPE
jgi:O-antigen/teichoic acid export membrane protein